MHRLEYFCISIVANHLHNITQFNINITMHIAHLVKVLSQINLSTSSSFQKT